MRGLPSETNRESWRGHSVTHPVAWDSDALRAKATLYFERAFLHEQSDALFAFWAHIALEQLARAAVAKVSPVLLAGQRRQEGILYALGLEVTDPLKLDSLPSAAVYGLCEKLVEGFGSAEKATCEEARQRRNAELHSATPALEGLPRGWIGRFFAACRVLARHLGTDLRGLLGAEHASVIEMLIVEDANVVKEAVSTAIRLARQLVADLEDEVKVERQRTAESRGRDPVAHGHPLGRRGPRLLRWAPCPACRAPAPVTGEVVASGAPRLSADRELVETQVAVPAALECAVCELRLNSTAEMTSAGLGDAVTLIEYPDPIQVLEIDLSDYRDEFLDMLAADEGLGYQDD
jgi:hypothetical protein